MVEEEKTLNKRVVKKKVGCMPYSYYTRLLRKAKDRGIEVKVSAEYIAELFTKQKRKCALSGIRLYFTWGDTKQSASLDRINSNKGYINGNVQWTHKLANLAKGTMTQKTFFKLIKLIYNNQEKINESQKIKSKRHYTNKSTSNRRRIRSLLLA